MPSLLHGTCQPAQPEGFPGAAKNITMTSTGFTLGSRLNARPGPGEFSDERARG
ncbi:MAG: hypothetical protein MZV64_63905 [Ignavibacteriales bacterium]|nr:hypothetical protein [Ignavibacteriales bacterium]